MIIKMPMQLNMVQAWQQRDMKKSSAKNKLFL